MFAASTRSSRGTASSNNNSTTPRSPPIRPGPASSPRSTARSPRSSSRTSNSSSSTPPSRTPRGWSRATTPTSRAMAEEELATLRPKRDALHAKIEDQLLVDPAEDFAQAHRRDPGGDGGDEAALFAGDLYEMYTRYARTKGWAVEDISHSPGEAGGFKEITFGVAGDDVYQYLRYESGGHRVQRVPKTETQGRIHTSLATVAVLPEPDEVQVTINPRRHRVGADAGRRRRRAARQQDRDRRPHLVPEGHARRDGGEVPGRAEPAQELRPGDADPAHAGSSSGSRRSCTRSGPTCAQVAGRHAATAARRSAPTTSRRTASPTTASG